MTETAFKSEFLKTLQARGFIHQGANLDDLDRAASSGSITAYIGFDATAHSLHVGSLVQIMMLRWLQKTGHRPVVLLGGATTRIGDPSDKDQQRPLLSNKSIAKNIQGIIGVFEQFLDVSRPLEWKAELHTQLAKDPNPTQLKDEVRFALPDIRFDAVESRYWRAIYRAQASYIKDKPDYKKALVVNNIAWLENKKYLSFLRNYGPHFTINRMLTFDSVKRRLEREQPLTFLEFNYMLMQAIDFHELNKTLGCSLQMGGSDQWGNIVNGIELTRRKNSKEVFGLTTPLLMSSSGTKMGKTANGAIWLNKELLGSYEYWQFWRNTADADVGRFLRLFTELPLDEISRLECLRGTEINDAKKTLADAATTMLHGADAASHARAAAEGAFERGTLSADLPTVELPRDDVIGAMIAAVTTRAGLTASNGEARRLAQGGGLRLNDAAIADGARLVEASDVNADGVLKLAAGKKKIVLVRPV